jgi:hypothetical protein
MRVCGVVHAYLGARFAHSRVRPERIRLLEMRRLVFRADAAQLSRRGKADLSAVRRTEDILQRSAMEWFSRLFLRAIAVLGLKDKRFASRATLTQKNLVRVAILDPASRGVSRKTI